MRNNFGGDYETFGKHELQLINELHMRDHEYILQP